MSGEGQGMPSVDEMVPGQQFPSPNQVDMERGPFWRAGLPPESPWKALRATIVSNDGDRSGESRFKLLEQEEPGESRFVAAERAE